MEEKKRDSENHSGRIMDTSVKEMPKNPFDFIWDSEGLLAENKDQIRTQTKCNDDLESTRNRSLVGTNTANSELVNNNTQSATTLETSTVNTTNEITTKPVYTKKSSSKKSKNSKRSSSKSKKRPDNEKILLVDEFNKQHSNSSNSVLNESIVSTKNENSNENGLTKVENSSDH